MRKLFCLITMAIMVLSLNLVVAAEEPNGELKIGLYTLYDQTLHPLWGSAYRKIYMEPLYDHLIGVDKDGNFDPTQGLAYKWEQSSDMLTWTFYIRDGAKFHNGDPLTIEDVKYSLDQLSTERNVATGAKKFKNYIVNVETMQPDKVLVHLKKPWPVLHYFLSTLYSPVGMIQPKKYLEEKGDDQFRRQPVGSGPYSMLENKEGDYIKLVAQDSHWRVGTPKYKYLTFKLMPEEGTRIAALRNGEVDIVSVSLANLELVQDAGLEIQSKKDSIFTQLVFMQNWRPEWPTSNKKVRQALVYAINKKEILDQIMMGKGNLENCALNMFPWSIEYKEYPATPYDPKKAKGLLKEAGYPNGFTMYLYSYVSVLPETKLINQAIAGYWDSIGIDTKILEMEYSAFLPYWGNKKDPVGPSAFVAAMPNRPAYAPRAAHHSTAPYSHTKDAKMDQLIENFEKHQSVFEDYVKLNQTIQDYIQEQFYVTGLFTSDGLFAKSKDVPFWDMGKGMASYRWEYVGSEK